jgi:hypothetical protein
MSTLSFKQCCVEKLNFLKFEANILLFLNGTGVAKQKVAEEGMDMLRDHWPFNEEELIRLCDLCFGWKAAGLEIGVGREVLLVSLFCNSVNKLIFMVTLSLLFDHTRV